MQVGDATTRLVRIGDVVESTGLTARAIRYYEECGLLRPALRREGANRRYEEDDLERLKLIKRLREDVGLSLADIRTYLEIEDLRGLLKTEYDAAADAAEHIAVLDRAASVVRRRVAMFERKLALVANLRAEDEARLARIAALRTEHQVRLAALWPSAPETPGPEVTDAETGTRDTETRT